MAAMVLNIRTYYTGYITSGEQDMLLLTGMGIVIFVLALWLLFEAWDAYRKRRLSMTRFR